MRILKPQKPHEMIGTLNQLVGRLKISELPNTVRAELLLNLSRCIAILAGVGHGIEEAQEGSEEGPESGESPKVPQGYSKTTVKD